MDKEQYEKAVAEIWGLYDATITLAKLRALPFDAELQIKAKLAANITALEGQLLGGLFEAASEADYAILEEKTEAILRGQKKAA